MKQPIKKLLENKNMTKEKFAKKMNITDTMMESIVDGTFGRLSVIKAIKIANFFDLEVEDIDWRP